MLVTSIFKVDALKGVFTNKLFKNCCMDWMTPVKELNVVYCILHFMIIYMETNIVRMS